MSATHDRKRRNFLKTTSAGAALLAMTKALTNWTCSGAGGATPSARRSFEAATRTLAELEAKGGNFLNVPKPDGEFLRLLIQATRAKSILELGTSHGYSAIWISLGLEETDGKMTTVEILSERIELAKKHLAQAGLAHRVTFKEGDAHKIVPTLEGPFDFVFLDADKDGLMDYFQKLYPKKILPGGLLAVHNAISRKEAMKGYLEMIRQHPDFDSVIVSLTMEDGFSLSYRKRA
ncbi:MAG: O-methyltransferase [Verrucomicrobia bacterium]|nr:O-methyltransferase [Verrucomicrobiota bacterium]